MDSIWRLSRAVDESRADEHLVGIVRSGGVSPLVALLRDGTAGTFPSGQTHGKEIAAVLLLDLARYDERVDDDHSIIDQVTCAGAIPCLVTLVRDGTAYGRLKAAQLLEILADYDDCSEGMCTTPYGCCACVAVMRAGGIVPLISLARDGAPPAQQCALLALAAFQIPLARDCVFPIPAFVREGIAELVREGAIPLVMALARGSSDSEVSEAAVLALNVLSADHPFFWQR